MLLHRSAWHSCLSPIIFSLVPLKISILLTPSEAIETVRFSKRSPVPQPQEGCSFLVFPRTLEWAAAHQWLNAAKIILNTVKLSAVIHTPRIVHCDIIKCPSTTEMPVWAHTSELQFIQYCHTRQVFSRKVQEKRKISEINEMLYLWAQSSLTVSTFQLAQVTYDVMVTHTYVHL